MTDNFLNDIVLYQDDDILIINKPSGLLSVPGKGDLTDSVLTRLVAINPHIRLVHRLDRDTSGIMVFAKNIETQRHISRQFERRQTQKRYQALVCGQLINKTQVNPIDVPVCYDPTRPPMHQVDLTYAKQALTYWTAHVPFRVSLTKELPALKNSEQWVTPVELKPITGRSHQLRVHLQYIGYPIAGDALYADAPGQQLQPRLALHAALLAFAHPVTQQPMTFLNNAPFWPEDLTWPERLVFIDDSVALDHS